ncbi:unnamed protein product [Cylicostephanus goldi]|uniref:Uncharacterized protein n=1 Tax=Cylicostephanus goldi TaxID=71465 RepID=A0A3P6SBR2_CYLGO|nr:unnamed protein product [Cylicostephanus goldi]
MILTAPYPDSSPADDSGLDWEEWYRYPLHRSGSATSTRSSDAPSPRITDQSGLMPPAPPDPHIKYLWNESVDVSEMGGIEQNEVLQLRMMLGIERISTETLSRYNVRAHMDGYDQPAILYPRYRGLASRIRIPAGLKVIRKVGERLEKENYPIMDDPVWYNNIHNSNASIQVKANPEMTRTRATERCVQCCEVIGFPIVVRTT